MTKRTVIATICVGVSVVAVLAASRGQAQSSAGPKLRPGGIARTAMRADPINWDVHQHTSQEVLETAAKAYNTLVRLDPQAEFTRALPDLAESWQVSPDGLTVTFRLHQNVRFHDGTPFTADDVIYSLERIKDPPSGMVSPRQAVLEPIKGFSKAGPHTVIVHLVRPSADILLNLANPYNVIMPRHLAEPNDKQGRFMKFDIVGTGPFKLNRSVPGEVHSFKRNEAYFRKGLPYLDAIEFYVITEARARVAALQSGRVDYLRSFIPTELFEELRKTAGIVTVEKPTSAVTDWIPIVKPPFDDLEVRKAAALAMCQEEGIAVLGPINGTKFFGGPLPPGSAFALPEAEIRKIPGYGHDCAERLKQGRDILTQKGLMGSEITLTFWVNNTFIGDSTLWAADRLQKLGFKVRLNGHERAKFYELVNTRSHPAPGGHAHSLGLSSTTVDGILGEAFHPGGIRNYGGYDDPTLRRLFEEQSKERDQSRRAQLLADYQRHFLSQYYHAVIGWGREYYAWREYVKGYSPTFNLYGNLTFDEVGLDK